MLYDPDADTRSWGTFPNLVAVDVDGRQVWIAETPTTVTGDAYYRISSVQPLRAMSVKSYDCEIDPATGRIIDRIFYK